MQQISADMILDAKGMACPMPIVKTKKAMNELEAGKVIEVQATDKGSKEDLKAWAESVGHQYLGTLEGDGVLHHYVRKASNDGDIDKKHPNVLKNDELREKIATQEDIIIVDVREASEYVFNHIPGAISIPIGELDNSTNEFKKDTEMVMICRTGNRSDLAAQKLSAAGFNNVYNVVPGMSEWTGETEGITT